MKTNLLREINQEFQINKVEGEDLYYITYGDIKSRESSLKETIEFRHKLIKFYLKTFYYDDHLKTQGRTVKKYINNEKYGLFAVTLGFVIYMVLVIVYYVVHKVKQ